MKQFGVILAAMLFAISSAFADGTKQFMPNAGTDENNPTPKGITYLSIAAQEGGNGPSRPFARYNHTGDQESCEEPHRLHIRIIDHENEKIHFGFGDKTASGTLKFRIKDPTGKIVFAERDVPTSGTGYIGSGDDGESYKKAYFGPKSVDSRGYDYLELDPEMDGDYYIEFDNGSNIGSTDGNTAISLKLFDITVVKDGKAENGRVWSRAWGLNTNGTHHESYTTFYTMSTDFFVSKVYLNGFEPYQFVVACNSFGSENTNNCEEDRKSQKPAEAPYNKIPEYQVFLTQPDPDYWGEAKIPNVPDKLTFAGDAMTCEDLIFVVQLLYNENATLELYMDTDQDGITDKVIAALLQANIIKDRGFHYPWKDRTELKEAGQGKYFYNPAADGCARRYTLSLFDQSYSYPYVKMVNDVSFPSTDRVNPGDSLKAVPKYENDEYTFLNTTTNSYERITMTYPIGSEQNPVLIESANDLEKLATAVYNGESFYKCIKNFYHYWEGGVEKYGDYCYTILNSGDNEGFRNTYFYIVAPTGTIELNGPHGNDWEGIGAYNENAVPPINNPFRGHIRAGRYQPNPTDDLTNETRALSAGDQDTIIIHGTNGLFAYCDGATIENIHVKGVIESSSGTEVENYGISLGGICDFAKNTTFSHCTNNCIVIQNSSKSGVTGVGGILGSGVNCIIDSCSNYGRVTVQHSMSAGGIAGTLTGEANVNFCYNVANVVNSLYSGGIVGYVSLGDDTDVTITNCKNEGAISTNGGEANQRAGGILGEADDLTTITACYNKGTISDSDVCGGICASEGTDVEVSYCMNEGIVSGENNTYSIGRVSQTTKSVSTSPFVYVNNNCPNGETNSSCEPVDNTGNKATIYNSIVAFDSEDNVVDEDSPFYLDEEGNLKMFNIECCGRTFRQEDAGRMFNDSITFYIKWDGKDSEGECVTGDVTVSYQKNSGVTHFPFYDPENNIADRGLVVYRISPIQDTITNVGRIDRLMSKGDVEKWIVESDVADSTANGWTIVPDVEPKRYQTAYQAANGITDPSYYGYTNLPKDYFGSGNTIPDEKGIELKLFWDDTKISQAGTCDYSYYDEELKKTVVVVDDGVIKKDDDPLGYRFGETKTSVATYEDLCTGYTIRRGWSTINICDGKTEKKGGVKYCPKIKSGYTCQKWQRVKTSSETSKCFGISNLSSSNVWFTSPNASKADKTGGYYGSTAGGHLFPASNFGNQNTMNTWWNGVEVKQLVPLKLTANEPAVLMPIELTQWTATNLEESVLLEWTTASEENNDYFAIERSIDGVTWKVLGNVGGAGTTSATHYYSFEDTKPVSGISYYRLKQVDFNGEYTYSSVKCINRPANADKMYKAYVNKDIDAFIVQGEEIAACNIEVYNNLGIKMTNLSFNPISTDKVVINVGQLPIGTYFIKICNGSKSVVKSW